MAQMDRAARDMGPISPREPAADIDQTADDPRSEAREDPTWNPGGTSNTAGADLATPSNTWNPGGTGNTGERDEEEPEISTGTGTGATEEERTGSTQQAPADTEDGDTWQGRGTEDTGQ